jgi:tripartite ATP-independent transporter DctM subunit
MDSVVTSVVLLVSLFALLGLGVWIGVALMAVGLIGLVFFTSAPAGLTMANQVWSGLANWTLIALPLFIWMGEILFRSRLTEDLFKGLAPWMRLLPGQLLHTNIIGSGIFAAFSGSSSATCATIGKVTLPELKKRNYPDTISIGSLCGASTLGLLIPPSIIMIVYGVAAEVSVARLFIAGILPGLLLMVLFSSYVIIWSCLNRADMPSDVERLSLREKLAAGRFMIPVLLLIASVIGSIYAGLATATEAAAVGVLAALLLSALSGSLNWMTFVEGLRAAMISSTMIMFIVGGASFVTAAMGFTGIPRHLVEWIGGMHFSSSGLLVVLTLLFLVLGCFIDGISMVVLTTAVLLPVIEAAKINLIWFGIYLVLVVEMSMITPPVGFNLFVLQGLTRRPIGLIATASLPFFLLMILAIVILATFPEIVLYLPSKM